MTQLAHKQLPHVRPDVGTVLPQRVPGGPPLWPDFVVPLAVASQALLSSGGSSLDLTDPVDAIILTGVSSGVLVGLKGGAEDQWLPVFNGMMFPLFDKRIYVARSSLSSDGTVYVCGFKCMEDAITWKELMLSGETAQQGASSGAASTPNRSLAADETVPVGGTKTHVWTVPGFLYATVVADPANLANVLIGPTIANALFPLSPGAAENAFVGGSIEFGFSGTNTDVLHILEYGRS